MQDRSGTSNDAALAHVLRRCAFGASPQSIELFRDHGAEGLAQELLQLARHHASPSGSSSKSKTPAGDAMSSPEAMSDPESMSDPEAMSDPESMSDSAMDGSAMSMEETEGTGLDSEDWTDIIVWWLEKMKAPDAGLHERMTWFWHGYFTTHIDKIGTPHLRQQQLTLREHALGNFRELAHSMVTDGALLNYLDATDSSGDDPNENLSRELMELFTIGRGHYTQGDVAAAARSLAGWRVDWETAEAHFDPDRAYPGAVEFLGRRGRFSTADIVDMLCDHAACAPHVSRRLWIDLVGLEPTDAELAEVSAAFAASDLDIPTLFDAITAHPTFAGSHRARPKSPVEWYVDVARALDWTFDTKDIWRLEVLGQVPYQPPSPAGWPVDQRWLGGGHLLTRLHVLHKRGEPIDLPFDDSNPVPDALNRCSLFDISDATTHALEEAYWAPMDEQEVNNLLMLLALTSPEFQLA